MEKSDEVESLKKQISDMNLIQQQLVETKAKLRLEEKNARTALRTLEHVEKVASQRIFESMPDANFEDDSNHLAMLLATVLERDDFEYDEDEDKVEPKYEKDTQERKTQLQWKCLLSWQQNKQQNQIKIKRRRS